MKATGSRRRLVEGIIFATILIDFVGFSILIPVLPGYGQQLGASGLEIGLMLALYSLGLVLFLPVWGWISDRVGRRPVLLVCLLGTAASFALLSIAATVHEIYVARALGGFFGASIGTAQAYMTDITDRDDRARGMGIIGGAFGIGFVVGCALGGGLEMLYPGLAFQAAAGITLANFVIAVAFLPESRPPTRGTPDWRLLGRSLIPAPLLVLVTAQDNGRRLFLLLFFLVYLSFASLEAMFALWAVFRFDWSALEVGLFLSMLGVIMGATQLGLIGPLTRRLGEVTLVLAGLAIMAAGLALLPFAGNLAALILVGCAIAIGNGISFPTFTSLFTKVCSAEEAGEALGQSQAMAQTGRTLGALGAGWAFKSLSAGAPFLLSALGMALSLAIFGASLRLLVPETVQPNPSAAGGGWPPTAARRYRAAREDGEEPE
ncbi:MAG: MFS transporter [Myxococcales bacterium]|nr:MFS transporter [Myxococcales bacterium]